MSANLCSINLLPSTLDKPEVIENDDFREPLETSIDIEGIPDEDCTLAWNVFSNGQDIVAQFALLESYKGDVLHVFEPFRCAPFLSGKDVAARALSGKRSAKPTVQALKEAFSNAPKGQSIEPLVRSFGNIQKESFLDFITSLLKVNDHSAFKALHSAIKALHSAMTQAYYDLPDNVKIDQPHVIHVGMPNHPFFTEYGQDNISLEN